MAQEEALRIKSTIGEQIQISPEVTINKSQEFTFAFELTFSVKLFKAKPVSIEIKMWCKCAMQRITCY